MRLYVHLEPADAALAWTKRLTLPSADALHASPSVRSVLSSFIDAYNAKFRPQTPLGAQTVDVYVEFHQNVASRRLLSSLDASIAAVASSRGSTTGKSLLESGETCNFELFVMPKAPPPLTSRKECSVHAGKDDQDTKLGRTLALAEMHMKQKKFRAARDIYTHVLAGDPQNPRALMALGGILVACGRHEEAAKKYFLKYWKTHGESGGTHTRLAYTSALKLAECCVEMGKYLEAVVVLDDLQTFVRVDSGHVRGFGGGESNEHDIFTDADDRARMEEQMDVLKAQALYGTKDPHNEEKAISLIMQLIPDLQAPTLNVDAMLLYAKIAHDRGKKSEALSMTLRVLVGNSNDWVVRKTLVSLLKDRGWMERLQSTVPPISPSAGAAYAFIATILKDFGAVDKSIACFQQAQLSDPQSASYALNHAHALEVCCQYAKAYDVLVSFFRENRSLAVGNGNGGATQLLVGSFVDILDRSGAWNHSRVSMSAFTAGNEGLSNWTVKWVSGHKGYAKVTLPASGIDADMRSVQVAPLDLDTVQANKNASSTLSEMELDLMACFFTVVKILFVNGRLSVLPLLIRALEPIRLGRELHRTMIRNEHAYYACIAQLLSIEEALELNPPLSENSTDSIYVCGDSHTLATAWRKINVQNHPVLLRPALVTGLKHWHLRKESAFYPKLNFWRVVASIPAKSRVVFLFGEIDCREGILDAVEKCKYESVEEGMQHTIGIFMETLEDVVQKYKFDVHIHPVVPVLDETRPLVIQYNKLFKQCVTKSAFCKWLDFFDDLVCESPPKLRPELRLDGTHLHPSYLSSLEAAFNHSTHQPK
ncbi:hypothetical protein PRIC1_014337 [Phytophthora ramorum]